MLTGIPLLLLIFVAIVFFVVASSVGKVHPFLALLLATCGLGLAVGMPLPEIITAINSGFRRPDGLYWTHRCFGQYHRRSPGAVRSGHAHRRFNFDFGRKKRPALAMSIIGATVSIPVFCDSGFIILSGLNDALSKKPK